MTSSGLKGPIPAIPIPALEVPYAAPKAMNKRIEYKVDTMEPDMEYTYS